MSFTLLWNGRLEHYRRASAQSRRIRAPTMLAPDISSRTMEELVSRSCPLCGEQASTPFLHKHSLQLVCCTRCSLVHANPVPVQVATAAFYDEAGAEYLEPAKLESDYADVRFARELRIFRRHCPRGSVLDVGCSSGGFLHQLQKRHPGQYKVLGTDVSTGPLAHAEKMGVPVVRGNFLTQSFTESFDAVTFWAVMEHLFEPRAFLAKAASLLKPGGLCFILVPNLSSLAVRLLGAKYRYIFLEHINYFTPRTLRQFAQKEFTVVKLTSSHFNPIVIWQDLRRGSREVPRQERSQLLKRTNAYKQSPWLFPVRCAYRAGEAILASSMLADNLVAVCRKSD
jgi:2-polyprenyl-3-methyl-5-hydroxy-6-metoxy-1,4-benzoquinol methylase